MFKTNKTLIAAGVGLLAFLGVAISQTVTAPQVTVINPTDLMQIIPFGQPKAGAVYSTPSLVTAQHGYQKATPVSYTGVAAAYTFAANQGYLLLTPATTIANLSIMLAAAPSDGARECVFTTNTITALGVAANTGQSINNAVTTLAANTSACYLYSAANLAWDRS